MISGLKNITARILIKSLEKDGFQLIRQRGSHQHYIKGKLIIDVPYHHPGQTFPVGTIHRIIKDTGWTEEDLKRLKLIK
jgi:predicted RNA binding protein YcfA (HicA-like mRNA interferase family)